MAKAIERRASEAMFEGQYKCIFLIVFNLFKIEITVFTET